MSAAYVYGKTDLGVREVTERKIKLPPRLRTMLILVDGHQPALILEEEAKTIGAPPDFFEKLLDMQLIKKIGTVTSQVLTAPDNIASLPVADEYTRFRVAKDFMNVTIVDGLGIRAFFFTLKLERAGNLADLRELIGAYGEAITKGSGADQARVFTERLRAMLL